eukprot:2000477-Amphidinium_carterae.2
MERSVNQLKEPGEGALHTRRRDSGVPSPQSYAARCLYSTPQANAYHQCQDSLRHPTVSRWSSGTLDTAQSHGG